MAFDLTNFSVCLITILLLYEVLCVCNFPTCLLATPLASVIRCFSRLFPPPLTGFFISRATLPRILCMEHPHLYSIPWTLFIPCFCLHSFSCVVAKMSSSLLLSCLLLVSTLSYLWIYIYPWMLTCECLFTCGCIPVDVDLWMYAYLWMFSCGFILTCVLLLVFCSPVHSI